MTDYIFDECFNDKRVVRACIAQGECSPRRYPDRLRGVKDPQMLPDVLAGDAPLVTIDYGIIDDNEPFIPESNAGIIIVRSRIVKKLMTTQIAAAMLSNFKRYFPDWKSQNWKGICLEISEDAIIISSVFKRQSRPHHEILFADAEFDGKTRASIADIARHN